MLIIIGALFNRMAAVLWVIAVLSNLTVVHRMIYTFQEAKRLEEAQLRRAQIVNHPPRSSGGSTTPNTTSRPALSCPSRCAHRKMPGFGPSSAWLCGLPSQSSSSSWSPVIGSTGYFPSNSLRSPGPAEPAAPSPCRTCSCRSRFAA